MEFLVEKKLVESWFSASKIYLTYKHEIKFYVVYVKDGLLNRAQVLSIRLCISLNVIAMLIFNIKLIFSFLLVLNLRDDANNEGASYAYKIGPFWKTKKDFDVNWKPK